MEKRIKKIIYVSCNPETLACISNIGPGLSLIGPKGNFTIFSDLSKIAMSFTMLCGRLEIYAILLLFAPSTWRSK